MRMDKLTSRFQQGLNEANSLAVGRDHSAIEPVHLALALLEQEGGMRPLLEQAGIKPDLLRSKLNTAMERLPKVGSPDGNVTISPDLNRLLNLTDKAAQTRGEQFISSELFFVAGLDDQGAFGEALKAAGARKDALFSIPM